MVIDRFEGEYAVIETDEGMIDVHISQLPEDAEEGDVLISENGRYIADKEETAARRERIAARLRMLIEEDED